MEQLKVEVMVNYSASLKVSMMELLIAVNSALMMVMTMAFHPEH